MKFNRSHFLAVLLICIGSFFAVDITLSIAGRATLLLKYLPGLSFAFVGILVLAILFFYSYIFWRIFRAKDWRLLFIFSLLILVEIGGCFVLFDQMRHKSYEEAKTVALDFLNNPKKYVVSYGEGQNEQSVIALKGGKLDVIPVYIFHPYGRYIFLIRSNEKEQFFVQLDKGFEDFNFFVLDINVYPGLRTALPPQ